jgi:hypothetical protein
MASPVPAAKSSTKPPAKAEKSGKKNPSEGLSKQMSKLMKSTALGLAVVVLPVFIFGEAYAFYVTRFPNSSLLLWLPILALLAVLVYKVLD